MPLALAFLNAFASTLLIAITARFAIRLVAPLLPAHFGAFTLAIGYAIARYSGTAPFGAAATELVLRAVGTLAGLTVLWLWWFRRRPATA